jgi:tetratricopeptide (TPR) repeat protein
VWGKTRDARTLAERALATAQDWDLRAILPITRAVLGQVATLSGQRTEAVRLLEQAQMEYAAIRDRVRAVTAVEGQVHLAEAYWLAERFEEAEATAVAVLNLAREIGARGYEAYALRLLAELAARAGPAVLRAAEARYNEALVLATELGMRPLVAHCHLGLGKLYGRTGQETKAKEHLTTATTMYRGMGMGLWLAQAERSGPSSVEP